MSSQEGNERETLPEHNGHALNDVGDTPVDDIVLTPLGDDVLEDEDRLFEITGVSDLLSHRGNQKKIKRLTTLPASPPAIKAKPRKRNSLAFHATPPPPQLAPPPSSTSLCLSMRLTMIIPRVEKSPGSQSGKVT
jgi:hypothetical protein